MLSALFVFKIGNKIMTFYSKEILDKYAKKISTKTNFIALLIVTVMFTLVANTAQAHYLWLDPAVYKNNDDNFVHLYFGEFHENQIESKKTRLLERKTSELKFFPPHEEKAVIANLDAKEQFYQAKVEIDQSGLVQIIAQDLKSPVKDWTKHGIGIIHPTYYARTQWLLYKPMQVSQRVTSPKPVMDLDILPVTHHINHRTGEFGPKVDEEVVFQVYLKQKPLNKKADSVTVFAPNGWAWETKLDKETGIGRFNPIMAGTYVIEVIYMENKPGVFGGEKI